MKIKNKFFLTLFDNPHNFSSILMCDESFCMYVGFSHYRQLEWCGNRHTHTQALCRTVTCQNLSLILRLCPGIAVKKSMMFNLCARYVIFQDFKGAILVTRSSWLTFRSSLISAIRIGTLKIKRQSSNSCTC